MKKEYLFVVLSGILSGFIVFLGLIFANMGLSLYQISLFPIVLSLIILIPFVFIKKYRPKNFLKPMWIFYGFVAAITVLAQFAAVILGVPVSIVVLLLYTQPLWTLFISKVLMKEKTTKNGILACIIVLIGMIILVNPFTSGGIGSWLGVIIALIGGLGLSGWVTIGSHLSKKGNHPITTKFLESVFTSFFLLVFYPILLIFVKDSTFSSLSLNLSGIMWIILFFYALVILTFNHLLYLKGVEKVPTMSAGIILLLEPVIAAILALIFLSQPLTTNIILGGILILIANYLVIRSGKSEVPEIAIQ